MADWDWYQATFEAPAEEITGGLLSVFSGVEPVSDRGRHGYQYGRQICRGDDVLARIWWGGNPGTHVQVTGGHSPELVPVLREWWPGHRVTRCDVCEDWDKAGLFDELSGELIAYSRENGIRIDQQGDWVRGEGRTLYLGSRSSVVQLVLYEKGYQIGLDQGGSPSHVRLEVRLRPSGRDSRRLVARWAPDEVFQGSRWLVQALERIGWERLQSASLGTVRRPSDEARARAALIRQYGRALERWAEEVGGWEALGIALQEERTRVASL